MGHINETPLYVGLRELFWPINIFFAHKARLGAAHFNYN